MPDTETGTWRREMARRCCRLEPRREDAEAREETDLDMAAFTCREDCQRRAEPRMASVHGYEPFRMPCWRLSRAVVVCVVGKLCDYCNSTCRLQCDIVIAPKPTLVPSLLMSQTQPNSRACFRTAHAISLWPLPVSASALSTSTHTYCHSPALALIPLLTLFLDVSTVEKLCSAKEERVGSERKPL